MTTLRSATKEQLTELLEIDPNYRGVTKSVAVKMLTVYLVLLMAIPTGLVFGPLGGAGSPSTVYALLIFIFYLGLWLRPASFLNRRTQPIRLAAIVFICVMVASYVSANRHMLPVLEKNAADRGLIFAFGFLGVLLMVADGIETIDDLETILRREVFGAVCVASIGIWEFFTNINVVNYIRIPGLTVKVPVTDLLIRGGLSRIASTTSQPIEFGAVVAISLPFALHQALYCSPDKRVVRWLQVGVLATAAPLSVSRSAILALAGIGFVMVPTWEKSQRRRAYLVILGLIGAFTVFVPTLITTLTGLVINIGRDSSAQSRAKAFSLSWDFISAHPWLGHGFSTFLPQSYFFIDDQYLTTLIETGVIGLAALSALFVVAWVIVRRARRLSPGAEGRHLAQCLAATVLAAAISISDYDAFGFPMASGLTFMMLGSCGAYWRLAHRYKLHMNINLKLQLMGGKDEFKQCLQHSVAT